MTPAAAAAAVQPVPVLAGDGPLVVTVVGAGPFTAALVDALADREGDRQGDVRPVRLQLFGRDARTLSALELYARQRLQGPVSASSDLGILDGTHVVLVQLRPGGARGRVLDEQTAAALRVPADESLGLGGLATALRGAPVIRGLARELRVRCPAALVMLLTNPLSTFVAEVADGGLAVFGCCELPTVTGREAAAAGGLRPEDLAWAYTGLSHRGFLHDLRFGDGSDALPLLVEHLRVDGRTVGGIGPEDVVALGAVPMKYHRLLTGKHAGGSPAVGRAVVVDSVRTRVRAELIETTWSRPPSLTARPTPWYDAVVAPVLAALAGGAPLRLVLDLPCSDGLVRERWAAVDAQGAREEPPPGFDAPPALRGPAADLVAGYEAQEHAWSALLRDPRPATLEYAVAVDPVVPERAKEAVVEALEPAVAALADQPVASHWSAT